MTRRALPAACIAVGVALAAAAVVLAVQRAAPAATRAAPVPVVDVGRVPGANEPQAAPRGASRARTRHETVPHGSTLRFAAATARIDRVRVRSGVMQIPLDPRRVGWWTGGAAPGAAHGTVVVVGHVNYAGVTGALAAVATARPGDRVSIVEPGRTVHYVIAALRTYPKSSGIPGQVFARAGAPRLVLITCGGPFDSATGNYEDNLVAYARPA